jgi:hypothetical protein
LNFLEAPSTGDVLPGHVANTTHDVASGPVQYLIVGIHRNCMSTESAIGVA